MAKRLMVALILSWALAAHSKEAAPVSADPAIEARMLAIASELRCLVCQNQTIADSHAPLAVDLRQQVREMLSRGDTDASITEYMTARYGDFILYRPPLNRRTAFLWFGPAALLVLGLICLVRVLHRRSRMADELFEIEEPRPHAASNRG